MDVQKPLSLQFKILSAPNPTNLELAMNEWLTKDTVIHMIEITETETHGLVVMILYRMLEPQIVPVTLTPVKE